jgi:hypothetical protein
MHEYQFKIKLSNGGIQNVVVQAQNSSNAKALVEAQYGKGCIISGPIIK